MKQKTWTLANHLTLLRLGAIPLLMLLLSFDQKLPSFLAAAVFLLASLTDFLDGFLARWQEQVTTLGKLLDPLADKLLVSGALIMLIPLQRVPAWMVFLIIAREIAVTGLRGILSSKGIILSASKLGKWKLTFQTIALCCLILHYPYGGINFHFIGIFALWIALFLTLWSGFKYFKESCKHLS
ncbi:MAG: CDP-diacylglycerol--glycerol-3-phosphate 3-phosphatidyltransferase [Candidatus Desulfofervidaceae bacterium]|nr:CDP-diacylglycerol--glycerol-3-phosphate 3-phosphatidyltransferase [Candidatus Desulfofervidaceae bacterium]